MSTAEIASQDAPLAGDGWVTGKMRYMKDRGERALRGAPNQDLWWGNFDFFPMRINDIRPVADRLTLDRNGLTFQRHKSAVRDFFDKEEMKAVYFPEMEALIQRLTGAAKCIEFSHVLRQEGNDQDGRDKGFREPTYVVHTDYTDYTGPWKAQQLLSEEEGDIRLKRRYAEYNIWRPVRGPLQRSPFALLDAATLKPEDLFECDESLPGSICETYQGVYNPDHKWYYAPRMQPDEVYIFKCYDSALDGRARYCLHSAFDDPTTPADALPRISYEARVVAYFDE